MATIRKPTYSIAIPSDAKIVRKDGKKFARFKHKGRTIDAQLTKNGEKCRIETPEWYVRYKDLDGEWKWHKGYTDHAATQTLAAQIQQRVDRKISGHADPFDDHYRRPLSEHLGDFEKDLRSRVSSEKHASQVVRMATAVMTGCKFARITDIQASRVQLFLADLRKKGRSIQTAKHYLRGAKQFCAWLVKDRRANENRIAYLEPGNVETDRRRIRRALSADEVQWLLRVTVRSETTFRYLTGEDRFVLYYVALGSGLRASEVASLTPESFDLDAGTPIVVVEAANSKRRCRDEQPLQADVVEIVRNYLADKPAGERLWPGSWNQRAADMMKADMADARAEWIEAAPSGPARANRERSDFLIYCNDAGQYADFHAQRHTYITVAAKHLPPKMAQALARHSDGKLTDRYTHLERDDTGAAAAQLPPLLPIDPGQSEGQAATGSDVPGPKRLSPACHGSRPRVPFDAQPFTATPRENPKGEEAQTLTPQGKTPENKADGEGFEPPVQFPTQQFSRLPP